MPIPSPDTWEARAAGRGDWPVSRYRLGEDPGDDLSDVTNAAERIAMMWMLAESGWKIAGRELPSYDRGNIPARLFPPGSRRPDDDDD